MVIIKKVLNSSVVLVQDNQNRESILLAKGIGYGRKAGESISDDIEKQIFIPVNGKNAKLLVESLSDIPYELLEITQNITQEASEYLGKELNENLYFLLADHLNFAMERLKNNLMVTNRVFWEIKNYYPHEFEIGRKAVLQINEQLNINLPEQEAANIAFHLVNAQSSNENTDAGRIAKMISEVTNIVKYSLGVEFDETDIHYLRFITHIKFFAERFFLDSMLNQEDSMYLDIISRYPEAVTITNKVNDFITAKYNKEIPEEELLFLVVHINRIKKK